MDAPHFLTQPPPPPDQPPRRFRKRWVLYGLFATAAALVIGLASVVAWSLFPGGEVRALRAALLPPDGPGAATKVEFRLGWPVLGAARCIATLVKADSDVADALRAVRRAEVSVHEFGANGLATDWKPDLDAADRTLRDLGWERVVGVREPGEVVGVYLQKSAGSDHELDLCVFAWNREDVAIVRARCDPTAWLPLVERRARN